MKQIFITVYLLLLSSTSIAAKGKKSQRRPCQSPGCQEGNLVRQRAPQILSTTDPTCPPCYKIHCSVKRVKNLKCKGGVTHGYCNCCPQCAKIEGEDCGGRLSFLGKCDKGLQCVTEPTTEPFDGSSHANVIFAGDNKRGRCRRVIEIPRSDGIPEECERECTPEYCTTHPKAICSARNTAIQNQECQGQCQHTACSACFFQAEPPCPRCSKNDFACMKRFAKCTKKKSTCSRNKYPCSKKIKKPQDGKFLCWVPKCL